MDPRYRGCRDEKDQTDEEPQGLARQFLEFHDSPVWLRSLRAKARIEGASRNVNRRAAPARAICPTDNIRAACWFLPNLPAAGCSITLGYPGRKTRLHS